MQVKGLNEYGCTNSCNHLVSNQYSIFVGSGKYVFYKVYASIIHVHYYFCVSTDMIKWQVMTVSIVSRNQALCEYYTHVSNLKHCWYFM